MSGLPETLDVPAIAALPVDAHFDNPAHIYTCPDETDRREKLEWRMRTNLRAQLAVVGASGAGFDNRVMIYDAQ